MIKKVPQNLLFALVAFCVCVCVLFIVGPINPINTIYVCDNIYALFGYNIDTYMYLHRSFISSYLTQKLTQWVERWWWWGGISRRRR